MSAPRVQVIRADAAPSRACPALHGGEGTAQVAWFAFESAVTRIVVYDLPPGASEGLHTHFGDDRNAEGAFEELYVVLSGEGAILTEGEAIPVRAGDVAYAPLDAAHGVANTHPTAPLKVLVTFVNRAGLGSPTA